MMDKAWKTAREVLKNNFSLCLVIFVFFASRIIYFFYFGVRFDCIPLSYFWQFIDPELLKNNLLQSVYYLHSQPPLFNLFLGIVLKLFPKNYSAAFCLVYMAIGAMFCVTLFMVMTELGVRPPLSAGLACLFAVNPLVVDHENWLFYEYPTAALLTAAALFLHRFSVNKKTSDCFIFFLILTLVVYIRGLLSLYWFLSILMLLLAFNLGQWKNIVKGCAFPLILILALYLKQYVVFGTFSISDAQIGQNLAISTTSSLPKKTLNALIAQNKISGLSRTDIFSLDFPRYASYGIHRKKTNVPVLDETQKSTGIVNTHSLIYLDVGRRDLKDAAYLLKRYPVIVLRKRIKKLVKNYFLTTDQCAPYVENRSPRWKTWRNIYKRFFLGATANGKSAFLTAVLPFLLIYGFFSLFRPFTTGAPRGDVPSRFHPSPTGGGIIKPSPAVYGRPGFITANGIKGVSHSPGMVIIFMITTIFFLIVSTPFLMSEQTRYRFMVDPFYLILFGLFLNDAGNMLAGRRSTQLSS